MTLLHLKHAMRKLSLSQLRKLEEWLHELIKKAEEAKSIEKLSLRKRPTAEHIIDNKTYRLENIHCGKGNCKCARGKLHGPYWYSYARGVNGVTSQYIGKRLPKNIVKSMKGRGEKKHASQSW